MAREQLSPERQCEAAEAALEAAAEAGADAGVIMSNPADLVGTAKQPQCLTGFARWEIEQASAFLIRLGFLQPVRRMA
jgi:hypothetical protein